MVARIVCNNINSDETFILTQAALTCGEILHVNKGGKRQHAERGRRVIQDKSLINV